MASGKKIPTPQERGWLEGVSFHALSHGPWASGTCLLPILSQGDGGKEGWWPQDPCGDRCYTMEDINLGNMAATCDFLTPLLHLFFHPVTLHTGKQRWREYPRGLCRRHEQLGETLQRSQLATILWGGLTARRLPQNHWEDIKYTKQTSQQDLCKSTASRLAVLN